MDRPESRTRLTAWSFYSWVKFRRVATRLPPLRSAAVYDPVSTRSGTVQFRDLRRSDGRGRAGGRCRVHNTRTDVAKYVDMLRVLERHAVFVDDVRTLAADGRGVSDDAAMTTCKRDARSHRRNWTTIAVTPCPPGWGIVYDIRDIRDISDIRDDDDTADYEIRPCPAILLQELRTTSVYVTAEGEVETITHEPPYDTRAVFADHEDGVLRPVDEVSNFVRALGPGEDSLPKSSHPSRRPRPRPQV
jgi:hypothetical protein